MHGVTGSSFFGYSTRKVQFLIKFLISCLFVFSQGLFISSENFVTSEKFLGSGMKWENSEPDSPKGGKSCEIYFTTFLNTLCEPLPMFCVAFDAPFHSGFICLIRSHIL